LRKAARSQAAIFVIIFSGEILIIFAACICQV
jgi:hypothetical protein